MRVIILACVAVYLGVWDETGLSAQQSAVAGGMEIAWQTKYDGGSNYNYVREITLDAQSNVYVAGYSFNGANFDCLTVKFDRDGKKVWEKMHDGGGNDAGYAIAADPQGSIYVTGFANNGTNDDFLLIKYDSTGNLVWQKKYDSGNEDWAFGVGIDSKHSVYIAGSSWSEAGNWVSVTIKYDSNGKEQWQKSEDKKFASGIAVGGQDSVYVAGEVGGEAKAYDSSGNLLWQQKDQFPKPDWTGWSLNRGITVDARENVYVTGRMQSRTTDDMNVILVKYKRNGDVVWKKEYNEHVNDISHGVAVDGEGSAYVAFNDFLMRYDSNGTCVWHERAPQKSRQCSAVNCDSHGSVYVCWLLDSGKFLITKFRKKQ